MCQVADEFALRSPVAFTEGMQGVQLAEVVRGSATESLGPESSEVAFFRELLKDRTGCAFDPRVMVIAIQGAIDAVVMRKTREPDLDAAACGRELAALFDHATRNI